jgi:AcrR family transcriptional regulator
LTGAERREAILHAAVDLFAQKGFRGTTTREIAAAVGVTEPVLYQHFATKRDLYTAIIDAIVEHGERDFGEHLCSLDATLDEAAYLRGLGRHIIGFMAANQNYIRLLYYSALEGHELADIWYERAYARFFALIEAYVQRRIDAGALRPVNPILAVRAITGMFSQYGLSLALHHCTVLSVSTDEVVENFVDFILNGIRKPGATLKQVD